MENQLCIGVVAPEADGGEKVVHSEAKEAQPFPVPVAELAAGDPLLESWPLICPTGFREYDARWWYGLAGDPRRSQINLVGLHAVGLGLGTLALRKGRGARFVTAHDYRSYSLAVKSALNAGLIAAGCDVHDIGLATTPMAYFAQFALDASGVAMVTASHNENGWTGVKMGLERPVTLGPDEMSELKSIVLNADFERPGSGQYSLHTEMRQEYIEDLVAEKSVSRPLRVVVACGNGTAGAFAPDVLRRLGCDVVELDCALDYSFPRYNPNPEDLTMLSAMKEAVLANGADIGLGFDGDGDRCGVVDEIGSAIFSDKVGVLLARDLAQIHGPSHFVVDVKSTALFETDPQLRKAGGTVEYWKTGHSHIKRRVRDSNALAGFEKSGHFFFNGPIGRGYDDGLLTAIAVINMLDRHPGKSLGEIYATLERTWASPTMSPHCDDEKKYQVVDRILEKLEDRFRRGQSFSNHSIDEIVTVNGVRIRTKDGTWGLVRASSNKPELVVVIESPVSEKRMKEMFAAINELLSEFPEVGTYNQML